MAENERIGAKFTLDINDLKSGIRTANKLIKESQSEFKAAAASMDDWSKSEDGLKAKIKSLQDITSIQQKKVKALTDEYNRLVNNGMSPTSDEAVSLRTKINNEKEALAKNEKELQRQKDALNNLSDSSRDASQNVDDLKDSAKKSGDGFTVAKGVITNFITSGLEALISGCKNAVSSLLSLPDSTLQFSKDLKQLETAFGQAGYSAEETYEAFNYFGSVLGDTRKAQETMLMLSKITSNQQELVGWTDTLTGVFALYGKSIPTEALSEGIVDTIRLGEVQGKLKDALENANVNVDDFNKKLKEANTTEARSKLIQDTLNDSYGDAAKQYNELNKEILDASTAETDLQKVQAEMGDEMRPVTTEITKMKTTLAQKFAPVLKNTIIPILKDILSGVRDFIRKVDWKKIGDTISGVINKLYNSLKNIAKIAMPLVEGAFKILTPIIDGALSVTEWFTGGMLDLAEAMLSVRKRTDLLSERQRENITVAKENADAFRDLKDAADENSASHEAEIEKTEALWKELKSLVDENGKVKSGYEERVNFINGELNEALGTELSQQDGVIKGYQNIQKEIDNLIAKKRAEMLLEDYNEVYLQAVKDVEAAETARADAAIEMQKQQAIYNQAVVDAQALEEEYQRAKKAFNEDQSAANTAWLKEASERSYAADQYAKEELRILEEKQDAYKESQENLEVYYSVIADYEEAAGAAASGNFSKATSLLEDFSNAEDKATKLIKGSAEEQSRYLREIYDEAVTNYKAMKEDYENGVKGVTAQMVEDAEEKANRALQEYAHVGVNITKGIANGLKSGQYELNNASAGMMQSTLLTAKNTAQIKSPSRVFRDEVGKMIGAGVAVGIDRSTPTIIGSIKRQSAEMQNAYNLAHLTTNAKNGVANGNGGVTVIQNNNYSKAHSRYEIYKSQQQTAAAVRLAMGV